jgi:hypothetical protein
MEELFTIILQLSFMKCLDNQFQKVLNLLMNQLNESLICTKRRSKRSLRLAIWIILINFHEGKLVKYVEQVQKDQLREINIKIRYWKMKSYFWTKKEDRERWMIWISKTKWSIKHSIKEAAPLRRIQSSETLSRCLPNL